MKFRIACWWLALGVFAGLGLFRWSQYLVIAPPTFRDPEVALNTLIQTRFGLADGAAVLRRELSTFPREAPLLVFGSGDDWTVTEAQFLVSYLAWPRPVWRLTTPATAPQGSVNYPPPPGLQAAGVFFYRTTPPAEMRSHAVGTYLRLGIPQP